MNTDYNTGAPVAHRPSVFSLSVVLPNYNGLGVLPRCFPATHAELRSAHPGAEILLVDDASSDGSPRWVEEGFPDVRVLRQPQNLGFGPTVNLGMAEARGDLVLLLNTDVRLLPGFLDGVFDYFQDPATFAVTLTSVTEEGRPREGANRLVLKGGLPHTLHTPRKPDTDARGRRLSSYPVGGHCVIRRGYFLELGGYSPLFAPFYWEDADLGWRAATRGWRTYHEPQARVVHLEQGSIRLHHENRAIRRIKTRNRFLLLWTMIPPEKLRARHLIPLGLRFAQAALTLDVGFFQAYREARQRWAALRP